MLVFAERLDPSFSLYAKILAIWYLGTNSRECPRTGSGAVLAATKALIGEITNDEQDLSPTTGRYY